MRLFYFIILVAFLGLELKASEPNKDEVIKPLNEETDTDFELEKPITVIARHVALKEFSFPGNIAKIDPKTDIVAQNANNLETFFRNSPNIDFVGGPRASGLQPVIRGYSGSGVVVLVDGARQNFSPVHNSRVLVDPSLIKEVNVLSGSNSALYGGGALGGVLDVSLKDASDFLKKDKNFGAFLNYGYNTANSEKIANLHFFGKSKDDKIDLLIANTGRNTGDSVRLGNGERLQNSKSTVFSNLVKLNYKPNKEHKFSASYMYYGNRGEEPNNPQRSSQSGTFVDNSSFRDPNSAALVNRNLENVTFSVSHDYKPDNKLIFLRTNMYLAESQLAYTYKQSVGSINVGDERLRNTSTFGFSVINTSEVKLQNKYQNNISYGIDFFQNSYNSEQTAGGLTSGWNLAPQGKDSLFGILTQDEIRFKEDIGEFIFIPALRFDNFTSESSSLDNSFKNNHRLSPKVGLSYLPEDWLLVFTNYSEAFRAPTVDEKYAFGQHFAFPAGRGMMVSNAFIPNPNLKPEVNKTLELGFGFEFKDLISAKDKLNFKNSFYYTRAFDYIYQEISTLSTQFVNVDRANIKGFESTLTYQNKEASFALSYSYVEGKDAQNNRQLYNLQPQLLKLNTSYKFEDFGLFGLRATFASKVKYFDKNDLVVSRTGISAGSEKTRPGYALFDVYYQYSPKNLKDLTLNVNLDNVFDKTYAKIISQAYQPGRNLRLGVSYNF